MTEQEARKVLEMYRETDDDTGEDYGYIIRNYIGKREDAFYFECKVEGVEYSDSDKLPIVAVFPDSFVLVLPT